MYVNTVLSANYKVISLEFNGFGFPLFSDIKIETILFCELIYTKIR